MIKRILIIQGHPDRHPTHFGHALADAYAQSALDAGHEVRRIAVAELGFPLLATKEEWETGVPVEPIRRCQDDMRWAQHLVILYPLWMGSMPAILKGFFEQTLRPGFAIGKGGAAAAERLLSGRTARIVVTMGMPALVYRWYFRGHSLKCLKRNMLGLCGIGPSRDSLIGMVEAITDARRRRWLQEMRDLGRRAA